MTAVTAAAVGGDLLDELRGLLERHDKAATLDDVREIADELTGVLRRTRGRIGRLTRKAAPRAEPKPLAVKEPSRPAAPPRAARAAPRMPLPRAQDAPPLGTWRRSPLDDAVSLQARKERTYNAYQASVLRCELGTRAYEAMAVPPPPADGALAPARVAPAPHRVGTPRIVLAALSVFCVEITARAGRALGRVRRMLAAIVRTGDRPELGLRRPR